MVAQDFLVVLVWVRILAEEIPLWVTIFYFENCNFVGLNKYSVLRLLTIWKDRYKGSAGGDFGTIHYRKPAPFLFFKVGEMEYEYKGQMYTIKELAYIAQCSYRCMVQRLARYKTVEKAIHANRFQVKGKWYSIKELAHELNVPYSTLVYRISMHGFDEDKLLAPRQIHRTFENETEEERKERYKNYNKKWVFAHREYVRRYQQEYYERTK